MAIFNSFLYVYQRVSTIPHKKSPKKVILSIRCLALGHPWSDPEAPSISLELSERLAKIFMVEEPDAKARWRAQCGEIEMAKVLVLK
jgi:hypothetical protein